MQTFASQCSDSFSSKTAGFGIDDVTLALAEDNLDLQTYAIDFWKPLPHRAKKYHGTFYHIQSGSHHKSPLLERNLSGLHNLIGKIVEKSDFMTVSSFNPFDMINTTVPFKKVGFFCHFIK